MPDNRIDDVEPGAAQSLANLVSELHGLRGQVREFNAKQGARFAIIVAFFAGVGIFAALNLVGLVFVKSVSDQIADCIQTSGKCYQSASRRSGGAVKGISEEGKLNAIASGWCQKQNLATLIEYRKCVDAARKELAK